MKEVDDFSPFIWGHSVFSEPDGYQPCTEEDFDEIMSSGMIIKRVAEVEKISERLINGDPKMSKEALLKEKDEKKKSLPIVVMGARGLKGDGHRTNENVIPSGKYIFDLDHLEDEKNIHSFTPEEVYDTFIQDKEFENGIFWVFKSPSGYGLKWGYNLLPGESIEESQERMAQLLPEEFRQKPFFDKQTDPSRCTFLVPEDNYLYLDREMMFEVKINQESLKAEGFKSTKADVEPETNVELVPEKTQQFPECFKGIPYQSIIEAWWMQNGGCPQQGERHNAIRSLARHLRMITDDNKQLMTKIIWDNLKEKAGFSDMSQNEVKSLCDWAVDSTDPFMAVSKKMKEAINYCTAPEESSSEDEDDTYSQFDRRFEQLLPDLPESLKITLKNTRPHFRLPVITGLFPLLGALAANVRYHHIQNDHDTFHLGLMSIILAPSSVGKYEIDRVLKLWKSPFAEEELRKREAEEEWQENEEVRAANTQGQRRPKTGRRFLSSTISEASAMFHLKNANKEGICCFQFSPELSKLTKNCENTGSVWDLYKCAFDREVFDRDRIAKSSVSGCEPVALNWTVTGTYAQAQPLGAPSQLDGGNTNRISWSVLPESVIFDDVPVIKAWQENEIKKIVEDALKLTQLDTFIELPLLSDEVLEWTNYMKEVTIQNVDAVKKQFSHRISSMMERYGIILHLLYGKEEENPITLKFARLMGDYFLQNAMDLWGKKAEELKKKVAPQRKGGGKNQRLLALLPNPFSDTDIRNAYLKERGENLTSQHLKEIKDTWRKQLLAKSNPENKLWEKTPKQLEIEERLNQREK